EEAEVRRGVGAGRAGAVVAVESAVGEVEVGIEARDQAEPEHARPDDGRARPYVQASSHRPPKITPFAGGDVNRTGDARLRSSSRSAGSCKRGRVLLDGGFGGLLLGRLDVAGGLGGGGAPVRLGG